MEKPATDIYSFEKLRRGGYTYVDKSAQLLPLVDNSVGSQFFLARPRRFGKSLLVSTMHTLFEGRRDLHHHRREGEGELTSEDALWDGRDCLNCVEKSH